ncbi:MAG: sigma-70 family RNA polymerase sigma factor [Planctomycetaceae bacterium]
MSIADNDSASNSGPIERLFQDAKAGSADALGELLQSFRDYLTVIADVELGSDLKAKVSASDLVQESCMEACRDFNRFPGTTSDDFRLWLRRVFLNNLANVVRGFRHTAKRDISKEIPLLHQHVASGTTAAPGNAFIRDEELDAVRLAIQSLPEHFQQVITLHNYQRLPFEEIALRMHRSLDAVRKLWARGIEVLQRELERRNGST